MPKEDLMPVRIICRLDIKGQNVVKTVGTEGLRVVGVPEEMAVKYYKEGIDEITYIDIVASLYQRNFNFEQLKSVCRNVFVPVTAGGGIRTLEDIDQALRSGADKVAINTSAINNPSFLKEAAERFGSQCIVLLVEAKKLREGYWEAYTEGGREKSGLSVVEWIKQGIDLGAGEIILASIDRDGTRRGYDVDLLKEVMKFSSVPVIAHAGAGSGKDLLEVFEAGTDAASLSSIFHYNMSDVGAIKKFLKGNSITIRK